MRFLADCIRRLDAAQEDPGGPAREPSPEDERIWDIDGYAHVVDGKLLCFEPYMFRLSSEVDREVLYREAGKAAGGDTVRVLEDLGDESGNYIVRTRSLEGFPEGVREQMRGAMAAWEKSQRQFRLRL